MVAIVCPLGKNGTKPRRFVQIEYLEVVLWMIEIWRRASSTAKRDRNN
jgi:hypothetical protein